MVCLKTGHVCFTPHGGFTGLLVWAKEVMCIEKEKLFSRKMEINL